MQESGLPTKNLCDETLMKSGYISAADSPAVVGYFSYKTAGAAAVHHLYPVSLGDVTRKRLFFLKKNYAPGSSPCFQGLAPPE